MGNWALLSVSIKKMANTSCEIHEGICGSHIGLQALVTYAMQYMYYWPTMKEYSVNLVKVCPRCQIHANENNISMSEYHTFVTPILFAQWGIDPLGPFSKATSGKNHLVIAIDHFTR